MHNVYEGLFAFINRFDSCLATQMLPQPIAFVIIAPSSAKDSHALSTCH